MRRAQANKSVIFLGLIVLILVVMVTIIAFSLRTDPVEETLQDESVMKVLIVLHDEEGESILTDVLLYYPVSKKGALFDILGNTGSIYESLGRVDRIDAIYKEKGIDVYKKEIEKLLAVDIPFTLEFDAEGFGEITDILGGMKVFVPTPVDEVSPNGEHWLLPGGAVTLDGDKIDTYINYILPDELESDREERKQNVLIAFLSALGENRNVIFNKKNFPVFAKKFKSNIGDKGLYSLLEQISYVDSQRLNPQIITGSTRMVDGKKLLFPYYDGQLIKDVVKQTMNSLISEDGTMQNRVYVINVLNGTSKQGLARNTASLLKSAGYEILGVGNADKNDYEDTAIINHIGNKEVAKALGDFIHCENIIEEEVKPESEGLDNVADVDFTLIVGADFDGRYVRSSKKFDRQEKQAPSDSQEEQNGAPVETVENKE